MNTVTLRHEQALVSGDGLTGLLAAQALTRFFRQVVVVEQPSFAAPLPAASPPYPLNGRDQAALDELFPGLLTELIRDGAIQFNLGLRVAWLVNGRWRPRYRSAYDLIVCQPALLLAAIRRRLERETAVQFQPAAHQFRLEAAAALLVDSADQANSAQSRPAPLAGAGRLYRQPDGCQTSWQMLIIEPEEPAASRRGAVVFPLAADQFYLALWSAAADPPPLGEADFLTFARSLLNHDLTELLAKAAPLTAVTHLPIANWSVRPSAAADRAQLPPPGYLPNPLLGQPVSQALAAQAALTDSLVEGGESDLLLAISNGRFPGHLARHLARHLRPINQLVQAETGRWIGRNSGDRGDLTPYLARLAAGSLHSAPLLETLYAVQQGLAPLARLFEPDIVLQTIG
jgi:hypothetical protein